MKIELTDLERAFITQAISTKDRVLQEKINLLNERDRSSESVDEKQSFVSTRNTLRQAQNMLFKIKAKLN